MILRPGTGEWTPGRTSPGLIICQLAFLLQAALRGLSYLSGQARPGGPGDVGWQWSPLLWGSLLLALPVAVVAFAAARRSAAMELGHLLLSALYLGLGGLVLAEAVRSGLLLALGAGIGALGVWTLLSPRVTDGPLRAFGAPTALLLALLTVAASLGRDYQVGTGLVLSAAVHAGLAWGLSWHTARQACEKEEVSTG